MSLPRGVLSAGLALMSEGAHPRKRLRERIWSSWESPRLSERASSVSALPHGLAHASTGASADVD
jgi:hypothetical protein